MTWELRSTLDAAGIEWPSLRNHIPCMAHIIQLAFGAFMSSIGVKGCTKSWEAHERNQQFGENDSIDIGKSQRLRTEGNARINKVSAMRPDLAKIIEKVCISRNYESHETDLHIAANVSCIDYDDTGSSKWVHWLATIWSKNRSTTYSGCENTVEFDTGVASASLPITTIHLRVAQVSTSHRLPAFLPNTGWMDHHQVCHGSFKAIPILDPVDVNKAYRYSASHYRCLKWNVRSYGWRYVSFSEDEDSMERRLILRHEVYVTQAVQILCWSYSNDGYASHCSTHPWSFLEVAIIPEVGQRNGHWSWGQYFLHYPIQRSIPDVCGEWILCQT